MRRRKRRTHHEATTGEGRWLSNLLTLLVAASLLGLVGAFLLEDGNGQKLGLPGAYVWVTAVFIAFTLRLIHLARYVLPPEAEHEGGTFARGGEGQGWREGLRMLVYYCSVLAMPRPLQRHAPRGITHPQIPASFPEFQAGFIDSHLAVALTRGTGFSRAAGPGYVRLNQGEAISDVIDLRRQMRQQPVEAMTRDGIPLHTSISLSFCVRQPRQDDETQTPVGVPYPYDRNNIFRLLYADGVGTENPVTWSERLCLAAAALLIVELARYRLDQLYQPTSSEIADAVPLSQIVDDVQRELEAQLLRLFDCSRPEDCPIEIAAVSITELQPPKEVVEQRTLNWLNGWERRMVNDVELNLHETHHVQEARAQALNALITHVTQDVIDESGGDPDTLSEVVMSRITEMMDRLIAERRAERSLQLQPPEQTAESDNSRALDETRSEENGS